MAGSWFYASIADWILRCGVALKNYWRSPVYITGEKLQHCFTGQHFFNILNAFRKQILGEFFIKCRLVFLNVLEQHVLLADVAKPNMY